MKTVVLLFVSLVVLATAAVPAGYDKAVLNFAGAFSAPAFSAVGGYDEPAPVRLAQAQENRSAALIEIQNPYTVLKSGDTWNVAFKTIGTADLEITSPNAFWEEMPDDKGTKDELRFISLQCGNSSADIIVINTDGKEYGYERAPAGAKPVKLIARDYRCEEESILSNLVNIKGYATLRLQFGESVGYAYDPEISLNFTSPTDSSGSVIFHPDRNYTYINLSIANSSTLDIVEVNWANSTISRNITVYGGILQGFWKLDNSTFDSSSRQHNGTRAGNVDCGPTVTGKLGSACSFDGTGDYILVGSGENNTEFGVAPFNNGFTVMAWVNATSAAATNVIISSAKTTSSAGWEFYLAMDTAQHFQFSDESTGANNHDSNATYALNTWWHVTAVMNSTHKQIYVNGRLANETTGTFLGADFRVSGTHRAGRETRIGSFNSLGEFTGRIDEVRVYSKALNESEIELLWRTDMGRYYANITDNAPGEYTYYARVNDTSGSSNQTETRTVVFTNNPVITFVSPTDGNGTTITDRNFTYVNVSIENATSLDTVGIEWSNGTTPVNVTVFGGGLVGLWDLDNNTLDKSAGGNDGTMVGSVSCLPSIEGKFNSACNFTGGYVDLGTGSELEITGQEMAVDAWVKWDGTGSDNRRIVNRKNNGANNAHYALMINSANNIVFERSGSVGQSATGTVLAANAWTHIIGVQVNSTLFRVYVNGVRAGETNGTSGTYAADAAVPAYLSRFSSSFPQMWPGLIDEVRLWNRAPSENEIGVIYRSKIGRYYANITDNLNGVYSFRVWANDSTGNFNQTETRSITLTSVDMSVTSVTNATKLFANSTGFNVTVQNSGGGAAAGVNVSCYADGAMFDSYVISSVASGGSHSRICTWNAIKGNHTINVTIDPANGIVESNEGNNGLVFNVTVARAFAISVFANPTVANTTGTMSVNGTASAWNGTGYDNVADSRVGITLNGKAVYRNQTEDSEAEFSQGTASNVNITGGLLKINLSESNVNTTFFTEEFSTSDFYNYTYGNYSEGFSPGKIFDIDAMFNSVGNVTYRFETHTAMHTAFAFLNTTTASVGNGNTSIWYSFDGASFVMINSTTSQNARIGGVIPVAGRTAFYVKLQSNKTIGDNPVTHFEANYTRFVYGNSSFTSRAIDFGIAAAFGKISWNSSEPAGTNVTLQTRTSADASSWSEFISYVDKAGQNITSASNRYIQFRALLNTTNSSLTPNISSVTIQFNNVSANATGFFATEFTVPSDDLGPLQLATNFTLEESVQNATNVTVWANTRIDRGTIKDYSGSETSYTILANYTRQDISSLVNGSINITLSNSTHNLSLACISTNCTRSFGVPSQMAAGNYTVAITAGNESSFFRNASAAYNETLETKTTSGSLSFQHKSIPDFTTGQAYSFLHNITLNNTGQASTLSPTINFIRASTSGEITAVANMSSCSAIPIGGACTVAFNITVDGNSAPSPPDYLIRWRANWTNNDGTLGQTSIDTMNVTIVGNASMSVSRNNITATIEHGQASSVQFNATASGSAGLSDVTIVFANDTMPSAWLSASPSSVSLISAGSSQAITITVTVPRHYAPGTYNGTLLVNASNAEANRTIFVNVTVPVNGTWSFVPPQSLSIGKNFSLNQAGDIGTLTVSNTGNVDLNLTIDYFPWNATNYEDFVNDLFESPDSGNTSKNPLSVFVSKNSTSAITLYQKGSATPLISVGVGVNLTNSSASPAFNSSLTIFTIQESAPNISSVLLLVNGTEATIVEQNTNVTIKAIATDDVGLNITRTLYFIRSPSINATVNASSTSEGTFSGGKWTAMNFTGNYTPAAAGQYNVTVNVTDIAGFNATYGPVTFTSVGTTTDTLSTNASSVSVSGITQQQGGSFLLNFTANNTGQVTSYSTALAFTLPSGWSISPTSKNFGTMRNGTGGSDSFTVTIPAAAAGGSYSVTGSLTWTNPDGTSGGPDAETVTVTISNSSVINITQPSAAISAGHGSSNATAFTVQNAGNNAVNSISISCQSGTACTAFTVAFNTTGFSLAAGASAPINMTVTVPQAYAQGVYTGTINASASGSSDTMDLSVTVPESQSYSVTPGNITVSKGQGTSGNIGTINITNSGNIDMGFNVNSTNGTILILNVSRIVVTKSSTASIEVNYSAPAVSALFVNNVTITNASVSVPQTNVTVYLNVPNFTASIISPTASSRTINVTAGDTINITANAEFDGANLTSGVTWSATIGSGACSGANYSYSSTWRISCTVPSLADGLSYDLAVTGTYTSQSASFTDTEAGAIAYKDLSGPAITYKNATDVLLGNSVTLTVNATDNTNVSSVRANVTYPNGTVANYTLALVAGTLSNGTFNVSIEGLTGKGDYSVLYVINDTEGNTATATDIFEVFTLTTFSGNVTNPDNAAVSAVFRLLRPNTTTVIHNFSTVSGAYERSVRDRLYDINLTAFNSEMLIKNVNISNASDPIDVDSVDADDIDISIPLFRPLSGFAASTNMTNAVTVKINYTGESISIENNLKIMKCADWSFSNRTCLGSWQTLTTTLDKASNIASADSSGFSAYIVVESVCGNGLCESDYKETSALCSVDCSSGGDTTIINSGGGGGGGGSSGLSSSSLDDIRDLLRSSLFISGVEVKTASIFRELFPGETSTERITMSNSLSETVRLKVSVNGQVQNFVAFDDPIITMEAGQKKDYAFRFVVPRNAEPNTYEGNLVISSESSDDTVTIPITLRVNKPDLRLLDLKVQPLMDNIAPGEPLRVQIDLINFGKAQRVDVVFRLELLDSETDAVITSMEETFAIETTYNAIKTLKIPENTPLKRYLLKGSARFPDSEVTVTSLAQVTVAKNILDYTFLGITYGQYMLIASIIAGNWAVYFVYRKRLDAKKRYKIKVELKELPQPSERSEFIGKIAETGIRAFNDLDKMQTHTLIAGSTGSGKTIAAQDLIEEALKKNIAVVVFDPTAQWTGFLRKCAQKAMLGRYQYFDMKEGDAVAFKGVIKTINNPREFVDFPRYMKPGEATIFNISKLDPKEIDIVVASTIQQVFRSNLEESAQLKCLIVYDEVHRLLPKFGGSGAGFVQLERGAREFRKWGIGLVLISQVLSDFVGEIKANIGTEIQMRTRYEGDLERLKLKYGEDMSISIVKAAIGTGMMVNSEYNRGRPYFVSFRPILHSVSRLNNKELEEYDKYTERLENIAYQIEKLGKEKVDTFDMNTEMKLASTKLSQGAFNMVNIYLESLEPRVAKAWEKLGKKAPKKEVILISEKEIQEGVSQAEKERKLIVKKEEAEKEAAEKKKPAEEEKGLTIGKMQDTYEKMQDALAERRKKGKDVVSIEIAMKSVPADLKVAEASKSSEELAAVADSMRVIMKDLGMEDPLPKPAEEKNAPTKAKAAEKKRVGKKK